MRAVAVLKGCTFVEFLHRSVDSDCGIDDEWLLFRDFSKKKKGPEHPRFLATSALPAKCAGTPEDCGQLCRLLRGGIVIRSHDVCTPYPNLNTTLVLKHIFGLTTCTDACLDSHSSINVSVQITELVAGSLADEVQRVTLRAEVSANSNNGTFRLEFGSASVDGRARNRVDADRDGKFWTSQLGANASADEVGTISFQAKGNGVWYNCLTVIQRRNCCHPRVTTGEVCNTVRVTVSRKNQPFP